MEKQITTIRLSEATKQELNRLGLNSHTYENMIKELINEYKSKTFLDAKAEHIKEYHKQKADELIKENGK